jgi:hypothetical protein
MTFSLCAWSGSGLTLLSAPVAGKVPLS